MIRYTGILMLGCVCIWCGFSMAQSLRDRSEFLASFMSALVSVQTRIRFSCSELKKIFMELEDDKKLCGFFTDCIGEMDEVGIKIAWEKATEGMKEKISLREKDINIIRQLGNELGMSDVQGQEQAIERVCELLRINETEAREEYMRFSGVYKKCGILTAVFIALVTL